MWNKKVMKRERRHAIMNVSGRKMSVDRKYEDEELWQKEIKRDSIP